MEEGPDWQGDTASSAIASKPVSFDINEVGCYIHLFFIFYFMQKNCFYFSLSLQYVFCSMEMLRKQFCGVTVWII